MISALASNAITAGSCALLVFLFPHWGGYSTALGANIGMFSFGYILFLYILYDSNTKNLWSRFTWRSLDQWTMILRLAVPYGVMCVMFQSGMEGAGLIAGKIPNKNQMVAFAVMIQVYSVVYNIAVGLTTSCAIRTAQFLGANQPSKAKKAAKPVLAFFRVFTLF